MHASFSSFQLRLFGFTALGKPPLLAPVVRAGFKLIGFACMTIKMKDFLTVFRHNVSPSETAVSTERGSGSPWPSAEAAPDDPASATSYGYPKDVLGLPIVESEGELIQVQGQILFADVVVSAHDAALKQAPKVLNAVRVDFAAHVFAFAMPDDLMGVELAELAIGRMLVGREQADVGRYGLVNEAVQSLALSVLDHAADHIALPRDSANDGQLAGSLTASLMGLLVPMAVTVAAADESLVHFHNAKKLAELRVFHPGPKPHAHIPSGLIGTGPDHPMDLEGADALLARQHQVQNLEPSPKRIVGVLEDRFDGNGEPIGGIPTELADPMEGLPIELADLGILAPGALHDAIRPAAVCQILLAGFFVREKLIELCKGHLLYKLWFVVVIQPHE
jgi:hypothetical protein